MNGNSTEIINDFIQMREEDATLNSHGFHNSINTDIHTNITGIEDTNESVCVCVWCF